MKRCGGGSVAGEGCEARIAGSAIGITMMVVVVVVVVVVVITVLIDGIVDSRAEIWQ